MPINYSDALNIFANSQVDGTDVSMDRSDHDELEEFVKEQQGRIWDLEQRLKTATAPVSVNTEEQPNNEHNEESLITWAGDNDADEPAPAKPVDSFIALVRSGNYVILDTETTGLGNDAEICQIAIIDSAGNTLLDTLVKPRRPIPTDATRIHGINNADVKDATDWLNLNEQVWQLIHDKTVIVYNADYDFRLLAQSEKACQPLALSDWHTIKRECAMLKFAEIYGDWNDYRGNYRWQKLDTAARYYNIPVSNAHTALGDCLMTLAVCKAIAGV